MKFRGISRNYTTRNSAEFRHNFSRFRTEYGIDGSKKNRRNSLSTEFRGHPSHRRIFGGNIRHQRRYDMNGRFQMKEGKNRILPKEMNANRFFWDSHWLEISSNHFCPSIGPNGGSVAMDSGTSNLMLCGIIRLRPF